MIVKDLTPDKLGAMNKKRLVATPYALLLLVLGNPTYPAESNKTFIESLELSLEDLRNVKVATATKTEEQSSLSPAIMTVITAQDIQTYGYDSVAAALRHVASFIDNYDLAVHNFGVRGINSGVRSGSRTIKFMIDGQRIDFASNNQNFIGKELIPMGLIERIEIVRGPVSALYGANAFLGVVNIITKRGEELGSSGALLALDFLSSRNAGNGYQLELIKGNRRGNWDYRFGLSVGKDDRQGIKLPRRSPDFESVSLKEALSDDARPLSFYGRAEYSLGDGEIFQISGFYQELDVANPFSDVNPLKATGHSRIALRNLFLRADYERSLGERTRARFFAAYSEGDTLGDDKVEVGAASFFLDRRFGFDGTQFGAEFIVDFRKYDSLLVGFDSKRDDQRIETFTRVNRGDGSRILFNPDHNETITNNGFYLQYLIQFSENWRGVVGFRVDDDSIIGQQESARIGIVGKLPRGMILKVLAGSAFQAPSLELLFHDAVQAGDIIGNLDLKEQRASTIEVSLGVPVCEFLHISATYFNTTVNDLVVFTSDASNLFAKNSSGSDTDGIELELRLLWKGLDAYFNYTWQDTTQDASPESLFVLEHRKRGELSPEQSANLGLSYYWQGAQLTMSWESRWVGQRPASTQNVVDANQFYKLEAYVDSTLTLSTKRFSFIGGKVAILRLQAMDLFDSRYVNPGFGGIEFPSIGRRISLGFEQRF